MDPDLGTDVSELITFRLSQEIAAVNKVKSIYCAMFLGGVRRHQSEKRLVLRAAASPEAFKSLNSVMKRKPVFLSLFCVASVERQNVIRLGGEFQRKALDIVQLQRFFSGIFNFLMPEKNAKIPDHRIIKEYPDAGFGIFTNNLQSFRFFFGCKNRRKTWNPRFSFLYFKRREVKV